MQKPLKFKRAGLIENEIKKDDIVIASFSSETEVDRVRYKEILLHNPENIDLDFLSKTGTVLYNHNQEKVVATIQRLWVENKKLYAEIRFSKNEEPQRIFRDIKDKIIRNTSIQYEILEWEEKEEENVKKLYATRWRPVEISIVTVPADPNVGIGRNKKLKGDKKMEVSKTIDLNEIRKKELDRINQLRKMSYDLANIKLKTGNIKELSDEYIREGKSIDDFRTKVLELMDKTENVKIKERIGIDEKDAKNFSFIKAIRGLATGNWNKAGFEKEVLFESKRRTGKNIIPFEILNAKRSILGVTAMSGTGYVTNASGSALVQTSNLSQSFIEYLYNATVLKQMGATVLTNLVDNISIPKQLTSTGSGWYTESGGSTGSEINYQSTTHTASTYGTVSLTPKTAWAKNQYSRRLFMQSNPSIEMLIRNDFGNVIAGMIDKAGVLGGTASGDAGSPYGFIKRKTDASEAAYTIANTTSTAGGSTLVWSDIVGLESNVLAQNVNGSKMAYLTNATGVGRLKTIQKASNTGLFLLENGMMNGYPVFVTNMIPNNYTSSIQTGKSSNTILAFGDFTQILIGEWGGMEIMVDAQTYFAEGIYNISVRQSVDINVRHTEAFQYIDEWDA